jgi:hypothetical protein
MCTYSPPFPCSQVKRVSFDDPNIIEYLKRCYLLLHKSFWPSFRSLDEWIYNPKTDVLFCVSYPSYSEEPLILTNASFVKSLVGKWNVDYLQKHMDEKFNFSVFVSKSSFFRYTSTAILSLLHRCS